MLTTQKEQILEALNALGLSSKEALVFLAAMELGPSSVWQIAKYSGLKRPTCYFLLEELMIKGLASSTQDKKRIIYSVISPKQLRLVAERRFNRFFDNYGSIEALASQSSAKPEIRLYEGKEGVVEAGNLFLQERKGTEIRIYGSLLIHRDYSEFIADFTKIRMQRKLPLRLLYADSADHRKILERDNKAEMREIKFLPENLFNLSTQVYIFSSTIIHFAHSESEPFATVIESPSLALDEAKRFELLWQFAKD